MPWTKPLNKRGRVDLAGDIISGRKPEQPDMDLNTAIEIAGNWRSSHGYPLDMVFKSLTRRAKQFNKYALTSSRTKRLTSVALKLKRFASMELSQMQDLGGCRAVLKSVRTVYRLKKFYENNPYDVIEFLKPKDYIKEPKPDGYRSIHLICRYQGNHQGGAYKGLKVEIQLRSARQHAWATALETIDTFTGQALKTKISGSDERWKRFFVLMSDAIAILERQPRVPGAPKDPYELSAELRDICKQLNIPNVLLGLAAGLSVSEELPGTAGIYVLSLDSENKVTGIVRFRSTKKADDFYLEREKQNKDKPHIQTVMVKIDSINDLKRAYPNYYSDTHEFVKVIEAVCRMVPEESQNRDNLAANDANQKGEAPQ